MRATHTYPYGRVCLLWANFCEETEVRGLSPRHRQLAMRAVFCQVLSGNQAFNFMMHVIAARQDIMHEIPAMQDMMHVIAAIQDMMRVIAAIQDDDACNCRYAKLFLQVAFHVTCARVGSAGTGLEMEVVSRSLYFTAKLKMSSKLYQLNLYTSNYFIHILLIIKLRHRLYDFLLLKNI